MGIGNWGFWILISFTLRLQLLRICLYDKVLAISAMLKYGRYSISADDVGKYYTIFRESLIFFSLIHQNILNNFLLQ